MRMGSDPRLQSLARTGSGPPDWTRDHCKALAIVFRRRCPFCPNRSYFVTPFSKNFHTNLFFINKCLVFLKFNWKKWTWKVRNRETISSSDNAALVKIHLKTLISNIFKEKIWKFKSQSSFCILFLCYLSCSVMPDLLWYPWLFWGKNVSV